MYRSGTFLHKYKEEVIYGRDRYVYLVALMSGWKLIGWGAEGGHQKCIWPDRLSVLRFVSNKWVFHACSMSVPVCTE